MTGVEQGREQCLRQGPSVSLTSRSIILRDPGTGAERKAGEVIACPLRGLSSVPTAGRARGPSQPVLHLSTSVSAGSGKEPVVLLLLTLLCKVLSAVLNPPALLGG